MGGKAVAAESIFDKAIGLIPGVGTPKRRKPPTGPQAQLATLKRNLSKLARDVDKLGKLIVSSQKKKPAPRAATAKRISTAKKPAKSRS
jgi:hypothetical protein